MGSVEKLNGIDIRKEIHNTIMEAVVIYEAIQQIQECEDGS